MRMLLHHGHTYNLHPTVLDTVQQYDVNRSETATVGPLPNRNAK